MIIFAGHDRTYTVPSALVAAAGAERVTAWGMLSLSESDDPALSAWAGRIVASLMAEHDKDVETACAECDDEGYYGIEDSEDPDIMRGLIRETDNAYEQLTASGWEPYSPSAGTAVRILDADTAADLAAVLASGGAGLVLRPLAPMAWLPPTNTTTVVSLTAAVDNAEASWRSYAIVDELDMGAVLNLIRLAKGPKLEAYDAEKGWGEDASLLASLRGVDPPVLVELADDVLSDVLKQIDASKEALTAATKTNKSGRKFDESKVNRGKKGSKDGGRFVTKGAGYRSAAKSEKETQDEREEVAMVQQALIELGILKKSDGMNGNAIDGRFGPKTEAAVIAWQKKNGYPGTGKLTTRHVAEMLVASNTVDKPAGRGPADRAATSTSKSRSTKKTAAKKPATTARKSKKKAAPAVPPATVARQYNSARDYYMKNVAAAGVVAAVSPDPRAEKLRRYWSIGGKGGLKIRWGAKGDWRRCVRYLSKYLGPRAKGYCQNMHKRNTGVHTGSRLNAAGTWPTTSTEAELYAGIMAGGWTTPTGKVYEMKDGIYSEVLDAEAELLDVVVAGGFPVAPPDEWFADPNLSGPTPLTIEASGQVYGHIATFDVAHIGMPGKVHAPRSRSGYAFFKTGEMITASGAKVSVGNLTLAGGHAPLSADAHGAVAHYDDTASAIADVNVGEDRFGIWAAGSLRPEATAEQIRALRASAPSGDWRPINGHLELVAICQVNVPGFPVTRARVASGAVAALVAAGAKPLAELRMASLANEALTARMAGMEAALIAAGIMSEDALEEEEDENEDEVESEDETESSDPEAAVEVEDDKPVTPDEPDVPDRLAEIRAEIAARKEQRRAELRARVRPVTVAASGVGDEAPKA